MFNLREYRQPTDRLPDMLPWVALVAPGVVLQKDGLLQKTFSFRGHDLESAGHPERITAAARINNALKRLGSGWAYHIEAQRLKLSVPPAPKWSSPVGVLIDFERREAYRDFAHFDSRYFLTFTYQLPATHQKRLEALLYDDPTNEATTGLSIDEDLAYFTDTVREIAGLLSTAVAHVDELDDAKTLTYLKSTISMHRHPVAVPETPMYLDALLPDSPFTSGDVPMLGDYFIPTATFVGFPLEGLPLLLEALNAAQIEYRWVTRFICLDKEEADAELDKFKKSWFKKRQGLRSLALGFLTKEESVHQNDSAVDTADDAKTAQRLHGSGAVAYGFYTATLTCWDKDLTLAREKLATLRQGVQSLGFSLIDETALNSRDAWLGSLPGEVYRNVRRPLLHTLNVAHLIPLSAPWTGAAVNEHLRAVTGVGAPNIFCSGGTSPFSFNLNERDLGHAAVIGPSGAGKSTLLAALALEWTKYPGAQVFIFDKDRSARAATLAMSGAIYEPGNPNAPMSWQPLAALETRADRIFAADFIATMLELQGVNVGSDVKKAVDESLNNVATMPVSLRTMSQFADLLGTHRKDLRAALRPYTKEGNYGQIFDGNRDELQRSTWTMFEMGHLMKLGDAAVVPALQYLFHRIEARFDGRATLVVLDEAWLMFRHPYWARKLEDWLKTLRKKNVFVVFATQEVDDMMKNKDLVNTILSNCATKVFLPDPRALDPMRSATYRECGLAQRDLQTLANALPKRDYFATCGSNRRLFQLDLGPVALTFAGMSGADDQKFLDTVAAHRPARPTERAELMLRHRKLDWAADLLRNHTSTERSVA
ncbi:conjugal transfer protein TrbE [Myxococcus llanfairpwllgwyngyllgogerychwyrndrobwllllantysiliogogogochensis]|uniref:Conjugal transfer protein TrbE n=1 Tax=Myxococcus llanfairpwllgwyngyllgogerychwyrndrobwllllantysiliogogogochensis TaxID=2590453 RepID=A0A540WWR5_9BACT|nr:TraM recognition domain-containing protein [Myxococcus llanfairpwllgwyngyllgogerychwyrndrobwllllantysiliogogogochensis]TQF13432.1 conjugal transfer protein TrbE [Myxococcus llanfairpwllgwyngyllgogerychwyrndrobwllllantysiliogogogochensis]